MARRGGIAEARVVTQALEILREVLERDFGIDPAAVVPEAVLGEDIDIDSIDAIDLALRLEDQLDIHFGDERFDESRIVADVVARLELAIVAAGSE